MFCHNCGAQVEPDERFCFNCGTPLRDREEDAAETYTPPAADPEPEAVYTPQPEEADSSQPETFAGVQPEPSPVTRAEAPFSIEQFWADNIYTLLLPNVNPNLWFVGTTPGIPEKMLKNAFKGMGQKRIPMPEIIGLVGFNNGLCGYVLGRNALGFRTVLPQDGSVTAFALFGVIGASIYSAKKSKGGAGAFINYRDIVGVSHDKDMVYVTLKNGSVAKMYMSEFFSPDGICDALNTIIRHL